ncbi:hypothetical protein HDU86_007980 [Geranomyces michiganensis]|nr:hypothetical protein HDU86_007980 [Geranomyces michiganensis]
MSLLRSAGALEPPMENSIENLDTSPPSDRRPGNLLRRPSLSRNMSSIDEVSGDLAPATNIDRSAFNSSMIPGSDRMGNASSMAMSDRRAMRRAGKRPVRPGASTIASDKSGALEEGVYDVGIPSWAEHRSAGERVLYAGLGRGTFMLALVLGCVLLVNLQHNAVLKNSYGPPIVHGSLAVASFLVSITGSAMVSAGFHHALTHIALTRGADCWIMVKELTRLAMVGTLMVSTWGLSLILSFAMVSVEWHNVPTGLSSATCTKPVYTAMNLETLRTALLTATSVSKAIFEDADGVGVISTMLPRSEGHVYMTADGNLLRATASYETATAGCTQVSANVSASPFYGASPIFCDSTYVPTLTGSQLLFKLGIPTKFCSNCESSSAYTYISVAANVRYYTGQISVLYDNDISGASRPTFLGYGNLVAGIDANLAQNFYTAFNVVPAYLLTGLQQARPASLLASALDSNGRLVATPSLTGVERSILSVFQGIMLTYTQSTETACMTSAAEGYGHAVLAQWVISTVEIMSGILAATVVCVMWESQRSVRELQPHAYVRGLSIMRDPLRFMVSMRDCSAFWTRVTGGCDASGDLLTAAASGLVCKYGEEVATRNLEVGHLMFGAPDDIIPIRDGREYSGRPDPT